MDSLVDVEIKNRMISSAISKYGSSKQLEDNYQEFLKLAEKLGMSPLIHTLEEIDSAVKLSISRARPLIHKGRS